MEMPLLADEVTAAAGGGTGAIAAAESAAGRGAAVSTRRSPLEGYSYYAGNASPGAAARGRSLGLPPAVMGGQRPSTPAASGGMGACTSFLGSFGESALARRLGYANHGNDSHLSLGAASDR